MPRSLPASGSGALFRRGQPRLSSPQPNLLSSCILQLTHRWHEETIAFRIPIDRSHDHQGYLKHNAIFYTFTCQSLQTYSPALSHSLSPRSVQGLFVFLQGFILALLQVYDGFRVVGTLLFILFLAKPLPRRKDRLALDVSELGYPLADVVAIRIVSLCLQHGTEEGVVWLCQEYQLWSFCGR